LINNWYSGNFSFYWENVSDGCGGLIQTSYPLSAGEKARLIGIYGANSKAGEPN
jgi:hypothetical protein